MNKDVTIVDNLTKREVQGPSSLASESLGPGPFLQGSMAVTPTVWRPQSHNCPDPQLVHRWRITERKDTLGAQDRKEVPFHSGE